MASLNKVMLIGNLTRDPEVAYLASGTPVAKIGLAVSRKYMTASKETKEEVCFVNVVVWGKQAEACGQYLAKGRSIFVEGRLQYEEWEKDGQKRNALKVVAERVQFLGSPKGAESRSETGESAGSARKERPMEKMKSSVTIGEEPLPNEAMQAGATGDADDLPF